MADALVTRFRVGAVLSRSLRVTGRNILSLCILTAVFYGVTIAVNLLMLEYEVLPTLYLTVVAVYFTSVGTSLLGASVVDLTLDELRGRPPTFYAGVASGVGKAPVVLALALALALIYTLGFVLFIVPSVVAAVLLWVAVPAAVVERTGIVSSLKRSLALTKGHRWPIFGLVILLSAFVLAIAIGRELLFGSVDLTSLRSFIETLVAETAIGLITAYSTVASTVGYHDLRTIKEGAQTERVAAVFD